MNRIYLATTLALLVCAQTPGARAQQAVMLPTAERPLLLDVGQVPVRVSLVTGGLVGPWDLEFLPGDGNGNAILVTESPGALRIVRNGVLEAEPVWLAPSPAGNDVLHGLAIHPDFARNGFVYTSYAKGRA